MSIPKPEPSIGAAFRPPLTAFLLALALASVAAPGYGQEGGDRTGVTPPYAHAGHGVPASSVTFPISCSAPAQVAFNQSLTVLHHMTYPQARQGFEKVLAIDPDCAMAHWGVAMTLFQPLWPTRPGPEALRMGWQHVQRAQALHPPTRREQLFIAAVEAFYRDPASADYWARIARWEQASATLYRALPDDGEAAAFYALSHLATAPANANSREHADAAAAILLDVYRRNPDHPGAMHYLIHANDVPGREHELLEVTRKYEAAAPNNPHALHMPTHIHTRLGDWDAVIRGNLRAADAALQFPAGDRGEFVWDEFPHAIEYLIYAYLQKGQDGLAAAQLQRLHRTARLQPSFKTAFHLASTQARLALERRDWRAAAAIVPGHPGVVDWQRFPWPEAIMHFARGLGAARTGNTSDALAAQVRLAALELSARDGGEELFARSIQLLRLELAGWIAHAQGHSQTAVDRLTEAATLEADTPKHPVTPAPVLPASELLGDLLMEQAEPARALAAYRQSLASYPRRLNSLLGAARSALAQGDRAQANQYYQQLLEVAVAADRAAVLSEARSQVKAN